MNSHSKHPDRGKTKPPTRATLAPTLGTIQALFRKLERESYRAYHQPRPIHKADHFVNFCISAHSMRDYFFEHTGCISPKDKRPFINQWAEEPILQAVAELANSAKHFTLRKANTERRPVETKTVRPTKRLFVDIYASEHGNVAARRVLKADYTIILSDGTTHDLYEFMDRVLNYWRRFLATRGVRLRRQSLASLIG